MTSPPPTPTTPHARLRLFGEFCLTIDGSVVAVRPSAQRLFARLALSPQASASREQLVDLLFPEVDEATGRARLSQSLHAIKKATGTHRLVVATGNTLTLHAACATDVAEFAHSIAVRGDDRPVALQRALRLASTSLLPTWDLDWVDEARQRHGALVGSASESLVALLSEQGDLGAALDEATRWVERQPLNETAHRELLRLLDASGDFRRAADAYTKMERTFKTELDVEPSRDLAAAQLRRLGELDNAPSAPPATRRRLVGRGHERAEVAQALMMTNKGYGSVVIVEGPTGIGKSHLLESMAGEAEKLGHAAGVASATQLDPPYETIVRAIGDAITAIEVHGIADAIDKPLLARLRLLLPDLDWPTEPGPPPRPEQSPDETVRQSESLIQMLFQLCELRPVTLVLDDVQWCDAESFEVIADLSDRLANRGICLLVGLRTDDSAADRERLARLRWSTHAQTIALSGLDRRGAYELATQLGLDVSPAAIELAIQNTGGNPLLLLHSVAMQHEEEPPEGNPIAARLQRLQPLERRVLDVLAVHGGDVPVDALLRAVGTMPAAESARAALNLVSGQLVVERRGRYRVAHDSVRAATLETLSSDDHQQIATSLISGIDPLGIDTIRQATLAARANDWHTAATAYLEAARQASQVHAIAREREYLDACSRHASRAYWPASERADVLLRLHDVEEQLGETDLATRRINQLDELQVRDRWSEVDLRRGWQLLDAGEVHASQRLAEQLLNHRSPTPRSPRGGPVTLLAHALIAHGDFDAAATVLIEASDLDLAEVERADAELLLAEVRRDLGDLAESLTLARSAAARYEEQGVETGAIDSTRLVSMIELHEGGSDEWFGKLEHCRDRSLRIGDRRRAARCVASIGTAYSVLRGSYGRARPWLLDAIETNRTLDDSFAQTLTLNNVAMGELDGLGAFESARALAAEALDIAERLDHALLCGVVLSTHGLIALTEDHLELADTNFEQSVAYFDRISGAPLGLEAALAAWALVASKRGDQRAAQQRIQRAQWVLSQQEDQEGSFEVLIAAAEIEMAIGGTARASALVEQAVDARVLTPNVAYRFLHRCADVLRSDGRDARADVLVYRAGLMAEQCINEFEPSLRSAAEVWAEPILSEAQRARSEFTFVSAPTRDDDFVRLGLPTERSALITPSTDRRNELIGTLSDDYVAQGFKPDIGVIAALTNVSKRTVQRVLTQRS